MSNASLSPMMDADNVGAYFSMNVGAYSSMTHIRTDNVGAYSTITHITTIFIAEKVTILPK